MKSLIAMIGLAFVLTAHGQVPPSDPLYVNSVVSNDIDFIRANDADAYQSVKYLRRAQKEMPDSRNDNLFDRNTFIFEASFVGGQKVEIWCHSSFGSTASAEEYAVKLGPRLGKLPKLMRQKITHVVIHKGNAGAFGEEEFFVLYSDNMDVRISNNDLEETVFHESVHASLDKAHASSAAWRRAQRNDVNFVTEYAESQPNLEDLAETTLFAYTMLKFPGRLPTSVVNWANTHIPNRIEYIKTNIFPNIVPIITNNPPTVSISSPMDNETFELGQELTLRANASDPDGNLDKVNFKINDDFFKTDNARPFETTFTPAAVGTYKIAVRAIDTENAATEVFVNITVTQKNLAPTASFTTPRVTTLEEDYPELVVTVDASDPNGDKFSVLLKIDGSEVRSESVAPYEWGHTGSPNPLETVGLEVGDHVFEAIVTDEKGASTTISRTITIIPRTVTSIFSLEGENSVAVFPNPSSSGLFEINGDQKWQLYNSQGVQILAGSTSTIDLSTHAKGTYILKIADKSLSLIYQ